MRSPRKRLTAVAVGTAAIGSLFLTTAPAADAASGYGSCGSGYHLIDQWALPDSSASGGGGYLSLYYNSSNGDNCAITQATGSSYGESGQQISVVLQENGGSNDTGQDSGIYRYYAGPVYIHAPGHCVEVEGNIIDPGSYLDHTLIEGPVACG
jgi:hypothetical protein